MRRGKRQTLNSHHTTSAIHRASIISHLKQNPESDALPNVCMQVCMCGHSAGVV